MASQELVLFDVDQTLVKDQSQRALLRYLRDKKLISRVAYARILAWFILYKAGMVHQPLPIMEYAFSFLAGKETSFVDAFADDFFKTILVAHIFPEAKKLVEDHQRAGRTVVLLSNAADIVIGRLAAYLGIARYECTRLEVKDGMYTGHIAGAIMYGHYKKEAMERLTKEKAISASDVWAYGDHSSDAELLAAVGHPYAVNPSTSLKKTAMKNNWPILYFNL
jgi:HAD superfamily hydrolase (TIGR01490 family)